MKKTTLTRGKILVIVSIILIIVFVIIGFNVIKKVTINKYKNFEEEIKIEAENYFEIKNLKLENGEEIKITLSELKKQNLISNELQGKCDGYAIISSERDIYTNKYSIYYRPYIKCGKIYSTPNYSEY